MGQPKDQLVVKKQLIRMVSSVRGAHRRHHGSKNSGVKRGHGVYQTDLQRESQRDQCRDSARVKLKKAECCHVVDYLPHKIYAQCTECCCNYGTEYGKYCDCAEVDCEKKPSPT